MGNESKIIFYVLNVIYALAGLAIAATAIWFFVNLNEILLLRNFNHYRLNYDFDLVQVIPWLYVVVGVMLMSVACCGWCAGGGRKGTIFIYIVFLVLTVLCSVALCVAVFVFIDSENTDKFIKEVLLDASSNSHEIGNGFGEIEKKYYCCGVYGATDYARNGEYPMSCCSDLWPAVKTCDSSVKSASERHGCFKVATTYAKVALKYLAAGSIIVSILQLVGLAVAIRQYMKPSKRRNEMMVEAESKKVLI